MFLAVVFLPAAHFWTDPGVLAVRDWLSALITVGPLAGGAVLVGGGRVWRWWHTEEAPLSIGPRVVSRPRPPQPSLKQLPLPFCD